MEAATRAVVGAYEKSLARSPRPATEERYRDRWRWDKVVWGTHCVDCYPGNCPMRVYVRDGKIIREEQAGTFARIEPGVPDMNPMGCQKGACWSQTLDAPDRVLYPLRRAGARGEGRWERVSWDEALGAIADSMLDAIEAEGPDSIVQMMGAEGNPWNIVGLARLITLVGGLNTDVNAEINDFSPGLYLTFGKFNLCSSVDDNFHAELMLIFQANPVYTVMASYHYIVEARYNGAEVVIFAPDCSPSTMLVDRHLPVRPGTDAAWALSMCKVIIDEALYNDAFVKEQTDLPFLVRTDTGRFLRACDLTAGGSEEGFYLFDERSRRVVEAPRASLDLGAVSPALAGSYDVTLANGTPVTVTPVFALLREHLEQYEPEQAAKICGVHPDAIRDLARKVARKRTAVWAGGTSLKYFHGDLMVRSIVLLLGLTGNWGRKGTGIGCWSIGMFDGLMLMGQKAQAGPEQTREFLSMRAAMMEAIRAEDPTLTEEMCRIELTCRMAAFSGLIPPAFLWYRHCGYRENWNRKEWSDPSMVRPFDDYMREALEKAWWRDVALPPEDVPPRVLFQAGGNTLRRVRGGQNMLLRHLWPKLRTVVTIDWRMSTTALQSDFVLPVANQYEVPRFHIPSPHMLLLIYSDRAVPAAGEAKSEWEIARLLAAALVERARARGLDAYQSRHGTTHSLKEIAERFTLGGKLISEEDACEEMLRDTALCGTIPEGTDLDVMRRIGYQRFIDWGVSPFAINQASDLKPDETHAHSRWHTEQKLPYPTLTRRAQFYIDHEWFLEAGEALPTHKENPKMGGDHPFVLTSGHNRWSIHSMHTTNPLLLRTHRGRPHAVINTEDARRRGIGDGDELRVWNDMGEFFVPAKVTPNVMPGQVIVYNGWEPYMFRGWRGPMDVEPGMVKWLHLAGGYGHLRYWFLQWQPTPIDRAIRVNLERAAAS
ncbi:MAG: molybdopterin-dependent oxidoreductase [Candidatus Binatia bacterium]